MRASTAAVVCALALLLFVLPATISASHGPEHAFDGSGRQLLVVKENATAALSGSDSPPESGSAASSVGADFNPPELASTKASTTTSESTQEAAPALPAQQQARSQRQRQRQQQRAGAQQQRALGRKGGPEMRQSAPGQDTAVGGIGGGGVGAGDDGGDGAGDGGLPEEFVGSLDDYVLPFCQPTEGVVCSDRDTTALLKSQPAIISLENAYPYTQVKPAASFAGSSVTTLDFFGDTFSNRNQGVSQAALETLAGTEAVNSDTTVTTTALQGTIDASRQDRVIPDAVSVVADRTASEGTYEWKSWRPRFTYQIGANYGLPVGLAIVTDTSGK